MTMNFLFKFNNVCVIICFLAKLLTLTVLFSTAVYAEVVTEPLILAILFFTPLVLAFYSDFLTNLLVLGSFFSNSVLSKLYLVFKENPPVSILFTLATNLSYTVFLTTSFFTTLLNLLKSRETDTNLLISNLSTSVFVLPKFVFSAKLKV